MKCKNEFCIYQKKNECLLDNIALDSNGCCEECIYPNFKSEILDCEKEKLRKKYENQAVNDIHF